MAHATTPPVSKDKLAEARDRFLAAEPVDAAAVRKPILASWWRSRQWNVAADHIDLSYLHDPDLKGTLARAADPVLRQLHEQLDGQPISIILTDADGVVLTRLTADHDLERRLDRVMLAPGFSYAEERVGTNGIGTALESGGPAHVFGHEHYAENLEIFGCAGVPIHDPVSGKTVGVIDLTCWRKDADPLMISLVKATADQITQALVTASSSRDIDLLQEYVDVPAAAGRDQGLGDLVGGGLDQRDHQRVGVLAPAGQVDHAHRLAGDRVVDRHPGAAEAVQVFRVVLVPEHVGGPARLQRGADAVGADPLLGVAEAGGQLDAVQGPLQVVVPGQPSQHQPVGVGQDDADRLAAQFLVQLAQHRFRAADQPGLQVGFVQVVQVDAIGRHLPLTGAPPRGEDRLAHRSRVHRLGVKELNPGLGQAVP